MSTDAIIAEAFAPAAAQSQPKTEDAKTEALETSKEPDATEQDADGSKPEPKDEDTFPKKAVNALSRRDKRIGKLSAEKQQLLQEIEALKKVSAPQAKDGEPQEADFQTYGEYLKAVARYEAKQLQSETKKEATEERTKEASKELEKERTAKRADLAAEAIKSFPDLHKVLDKAFDGIQLKAHVIEALDEADNGAIALYSLAKDDFDFEELNEMSPAKVAMTIGRAEDKGLALTKTKQVTKAPAPMTPAKGNGASSGKPLDLMSGDELLKWVKS